MHATPRSASQQKLLHHHPALLLMSSHQESGLSGPEFFFLKEVRHRCDTLTPCLQELLDFRPSPHWKQE